MLTDLVSSSRVSGLQEWLTVTGLLSLHTGEHLGAEPDLMAEGFSNRASPTSSIVLTSELKAHFLLFLSWHETEEQLS